MNKKVTTIRVCLTLLLAVFVFFGRGAPTVQASNIYTNDFESGVPLVSTSVVCTTHAISPTHCDTMSVSISSVSTSAFTGQTGNMSVDFYGTITSDTGFHNLRSSLDINGGFNLIGFWNNHSAGKWEIWDASQTYAIVTGLTYGTMYHIIINIDIGADTFTLSTDGGSTFSSSYALTNTVATATTMTFSRNGGNGDLDIDDFKVDSAYFSAGTCVDGIQNQDETGIDIGGVCATIVINTPVDTTDVQDFNNYSVTYSGLDLPSQNHQIVVQWSDNSALMTTCENGVAGSMYTGSFVAGASYTTCTNSLPRIYIDENAISFSSGIHSYTGSVPKTHSLTNGTTYYAQAFIVGDDGFYYVASPVISFTASNGVPVVTGNGTITNSAGLGTITGTGTHFTSTLHIGDTLTVGGQQCTVLSIASDTELECTPLTSAHSTASYTQNSNFDSSVLSETCSTWDFGCYIKNVVVWFFGVSDTTLQNFGTLKDSLMSRFPFSYIADTGVLLGEVFNQSADSFTLDIPFMGNTFTILSTTQLEAISFQPLVRTIMGGIMMFFTVLFIYRKVIKVHDAGHQTTT